MTNLYVGMMRDYLKGYYKKQKAYNTQIAENNKRFSPDYATTENKKVREQQKTAYNEARAKISEVFTTVRGLLANANFVNVESLTADRLLFSENSGFDLSVEEVRAFAERYANNYTMLRLIRDWIARHDAPTEKHPLGKYASVNITLPVDMVEVYKVFAESALSVIEQIYNNGTIMQEYDATVYDADTRQQSKAEKREYPLEIEAFGNEDFAKDLFAVIGNGNDLSDYKSRRVPETARHAFDSIVLA